MLGNKRPQSKSLNNTSLSLLKPYLYNNKLLTLGALVSIILAAGVMLLLPIAVRGVLDKGFSSGSTVSNVHFMFLLFLALLLACASAGRYFSVVMLGEKVIADLRTDIYEHIIRLPINFFDTTSSGEIISRLSADAAQIKDTIGTVTSVALRNIIMAVGALVMMFVTDYKLSLMVVLTIPFIIFFLLFFARKVRVKTRKAQDQLARANALVSESIISISTVKSYARERFVGSQFIGLVKNAYDSALSSVATRAFLTGFAIFIIFSSVIIVLYIGAYDVIMHKLTAGTLGQFVLYAIFAASSFGQLSEVGSQFAQALGAMGRLVELRNEPTEINYYKPDGNKGGIVGDIEFKNISFSYPSRPERKILNDFSLYVKKGEKVAFVGATGAGKSTIFSLLLNFYKPDSGSITIGGVNIDDLSLSKLRESIAYVSQDIAIFNGSIAENISFANPNATKEEIINAAKLAYAYEFIETMPEGIETMVGERGVMLSGGQKQRISLSRAFLKNSPILLLDEATSALDAQSESYVSAALEDLMKDRTTFIIAHRLATVVNANRIFVLEHGTIVEHGTHEELIAKDGYYARLAKLQFNK